MSKTEQLDLSRMEPKQLADVLSKVSGATIPMSKIIYDIEQGAPTNADGTMNAIHYAAWLVSQEN